MRSAKVKQTTVDPKQKCFLKFEKKQTLVKDLGCTKILCNFTVPSIDCRLRKKKLAKVQSDKDCVGEICNELKRHCRIHKWIYCPPNVRAIKTKSKKKYRQ